MPVTDYLVLAPLQQEWEAARPILTPRGKRLNEVPVDAITYWAWAQPVTTRQYEGEYLIAAAPISLWTPGSSVASAVASQALSRWVPSTIALMGIAGSIEPETVRLGDVVVATEVRGYEISDQYPDSERLWPTFHQPALVNKSRTAAFKMDEKSYNAWRESCLADAAKHGLGSVVTRAPELHVGELASGNRVVKSVEFAQRLKQEISKYIIVVEMEANAVHQAVYVDAGRANVLTIRGISDYADPDKEQLEKRSKDGWRTWAASNAARLFRALLKRGTVAPISPAYDLTLTRGPYGQFSERGVPRITFDHNGSQHIAFPSLLKRSVPTPALELRVAATKDDGQPATGFRGVCLIETPEPSSIQRTETRRALRFDLPASELGLDVQLLLAFPSACRQIVVSCRDDFGRRAKQVLDLPPPIAGGTA